MWIRELVHCRNIGYLSSTATPSQTYALTALVALKQ